MSESRKAKFHGVRLAIRVKHRELGAGLFADSSRRVLRHPY